MSREVYEEEILASLLELLYLVLQFTDFLSHVLSCILMSKASVPLSRIFFRLFTIRDKFSNRDQSGTNRNDENAMCYYSSEKLGMCFR